MSRRWDGKRGKSGVSDIIGTILILAITVTLFSSIFFFVSSLPGPPPSNTSQFTAGLGVSAGGTESNVNITYTTGPVLAGGGGTDIYLRSQAHPGTFSCMDPYDIAIGLSGQSTWSAGQTWSIHLIPGTTTCTGQPLSAAGDNLTIEIVNPVKNLVLFEVTLPGTQANIPPEFLSEGYSPSPVLNTGPFSVWAQIRDDDLRPNSVFANLTVIPGPISGPGYVTRCSCIKMYYDSTLGEWNTSQLTTSSSSVIGSSFPITINATDKIGQVNSVVLYLSFVTPQGANLQVSLSASPGDPTINENTTISATVSNSGGAGGLATITFASATGDFCPWKIAGTCPTMSVSTSVPPFASGMVVSVYWNASGTSPIGDGAATITASETPLNAQTINPLVVTVYPKTVLIDGTGVAQGSIAPIDPFTYLTADFTSANIPYFTLVAPPGSSTITYAGSASTALDNYNVIIWDVGNSSAGTCLSTTDASAVQTALTNNRAAWMMGGDAFSCASASYDGNFGVTSGASAPAAAPIGLSLKFGGIAPQAGYPATMYAGSGTSYSTLSLNGATSYLCNGACGGANDLATAYKPASPHGPAFTTSFDMAALTKLVTFPGGSAYVADTGAQASLVYNAFNFLAGFYTPGSPPTNNAHGTDWAVSGVSVEPSSLSYETKAYVSVTIRNNGVYPTPITAELLIDGLPVAGYSVTLSPSTSGGSVSGTITWSPAVVGYITIGAELILTPATANDSNSVNNIMYSSLFNVQTYVGYSVLVVDASLHNLSPSSFHDVTNSTVIPSLVAAGYNASTINETYITSRCGTLKTALSNYNMVVWYTGQVTNGTGVINPAPCPLSDANANLLTSFLVNGGIRSSLLFISPGLMAQGAPSAIDLSFAQTYLGTTITNAVTTAGVNNLFGKTTDTVGNGLDIPYRYAGNTSGYTCLLSGSGSGSLYYNVSTSPIDYWSAGQTGTACAGTDTLGSNGWHSAYWAFSPFSAGNSNQLSLAVLRASTFFGRLLPNSDTVVSPPDITFATAARSWTNFDSMHPQLEQQYLIVSNITNLGANTANNLGVSLYDGSHILGSQTLTIGGSTPSVSGRVTLGTGQFSVAWTPLYAGTNKITVSITSSTAGQVLPGVENKAAWNLTVYFFYDDGGAGENVWTHSQLSLIQTTEDPSCVPALTGASIYSFAGHTNVPGEFPQGHITGVTQGYNPSSGTSYGYTTVGSNGDCETYWPGGGLYTKGYASTWPNYAHLRTLTETCPIGNLPAYPYLTDMDGNKELYCPGAWGIDNMGAGDTGNSGDACYLVTASYMCASLAILDDNQQPNYVAPWTYSSAVYVPSDISSASASFWSRYNLAYAFSGGLLCVVDSSTQTGTYTGTGGGDGIGNTPTCSAGPGGSVPMPSPGYTGTIPSGGCNVVSVFTGSSAGGTEGWQQENVNLTQFAGKWVKLAFNWLEGNTGGCGGTPPAFSGAGWWINGLSFYASNTGSVSTATDTVTEGTGSAYCDAPSSPPTPYYPQFVPNDLWHRLGSGNVPSPYGTLPAGSQGAWVSAVPNNAGTLQLDPNMWDSLNTRAIDLTQASQAALNFQYVSNVDNANYNPAMGLALLASPVSSSGQFNWVQLWASGTGGGTGWHSSGSISLNGYIGEVVELAFVGGTNCNQVAYPFGGAFLLSDVQVSGATIVSSVHQGQTSTLPNPIDMPALSATTVTAPLSGLVTAHAAGTYGDAITHATSTGLVVTAAGAPRGQDGMATPRTFVVGNKNLR